MRSAGMGMGCDDISDGVWAKADEDDWEGGQGLGDVGR